MFDVKVKHASKLDDMARDFMIPLTVFASSIAAAVRYRVQNFGVNALGTPMKGYGLMGIAGVGARYWARPGKPQPVIAKGINKSVHITRGAFAGWAHYRSYRSYLRVTGQLGKPHDYSASGIMWSRLGVFTLSPAHVRVRFGGGRSKVRGKKTLTNARVAWASSKDEDRPILEPSSVEREGAAVDLKRAIARQFQKHELDLGGYAKIAHSLGRSQKVIDTYAKAGRVSARAAALRAQLEELGITP